MNQIKFSESVKDEKGIAISVENSVEEIKEIGEVLKLFYFFLYI